jgi:hypothetical protein
VHFAPIEMKEALAARAARKALLSRLYASLA